MTSEDKINWAVTELSNGYISDTVTILAGMNLFNNSLEIDRYFAQALSERSDIKLEKEECIMEYVKSIVKQLSVKNNNYKEIIKLLDKIYLDSDYDQRFAIWSNIDSAIIDIESGCYPYSYEKAYNNNIQDLIIEEAKAFLKNCGENI